MTSSALVVGTGLLGTSIGLALRRSQWRVWLHDHDERSARLSASLGAGEWGQPESDPDVVVVAVPPGETGRVIHQLSQQYPDSTFTDVSSVKFGVQLDIERLGPAARFVGGHPMAGRERSGPEAARADLFDGRPWVLCPTPVSNPERVAAVTELVLACGGQPVVMDAQTHDAAVGRVSHVPQIVASALAGQLVSASQAELDLAGQGLRDTARIAASDPGLWVEILAANPQPVREVLESVIADLSAVSIALGGLVDQHGGSDLSVSRETDKATIDSIEVIRSILDRGRRGIARVPGKHGAESVEYAVIPVVIPDEPGALARLLVGAGEAGINVEDLAIEHSPGQPVGLVELLVLPEQASQLREALSAQGWSVH